MRMGQELKFIAENPGDETRMPATRAVERPTMTSEQINRLIQGVEDAHDLRLMCIGVAGRKSPDEQKTFSSGGFTPSPTD